MLLASVCCGKVCIVRHIRGLLFGHSQYISQMSMFMRTLMLSRWSFGANRVQVDADIKVMSEFLVHLQGDSIRNMSSLSSLPPHQSASKTSREHCELFFPFALN